MLKLLFKIFDFIMETQNKFYQTKYKSQSSMFFSDSTTKFSMNTACTMKLSSKTEENKAKINKVAKQIILKNIKSPEKILEFIEQKGTKVYQSDKAAFILSAIGEEEGFITSMRGQRALCLNFLIGVLIEKKLKISFSSPEIFMFRDAPVDIYMLSHNLHRWYGYKMKLPGYDYETQEKFKKVYKTLNDVEISKFSFSDVMSVKEAVARNVESINFVVNIAKEYEGSKKSLAKIVASGGASV